MASSNLSILLVLGDVSKAHSNDVVFIEYLLYGGLELLLGEVVDN